MRRRFANWCSVGERGGETPGEPVGEQKGESKNSDGGAGAGGMGDPGATEVGGECGITGERGPTGRVAGEAGERTRSLLFWGIMCEKLMGERSEFGRICLTVGEVEVGICGGEGGGELEMLEVGEMEAEPEELDGGVIFANAHSSPTELLISS